MRQSPHLHICTSAHLHICTSAFDFIDISPQSIMALLMLRIPLIFVVLMFSIQAFAQNFDNYTDFLKIDKSDRQGLDWDEKNIFNVGEEFWTVNADSWSSGPRGEVRQVLEIWVNEQLFYAENNAEDADEEGYASAKKTLMLPRERGTYHVMIKCGAKGRKSERCKLSIYPPRPTSPVPPPPTATKPDSKNQFWMLLEPMEYEIGNANVSIVVPAGFVHDFASIPQIFHSLGLSPHGLYSRAALIHDWLYWSQSCTPTQANRIMVLAMKESGVSTALAMSIYAVLEVAGGSAWKQNTVDRNNGLPRIIPESLRNLPPNKTWPDYRKELFENGIRDSAMPTAAYCSYGDSFDVPGGISHPVSGAPQFQSIISPENER